LSEDAINNQQSVPYSLLYSVAPEQFSHLHLSNDAVGDEFEWDESENQYEGESLASNVLEFLKELAAE
jgi:hypothetical protein